jgi:phosphoribosylformylglycinamidine cyclo-ligase
MHRTFNMGIGMVIVVSAEKAGLVRAHLDTQGDAHYDIGRIVEGSRTVSIHGESPHG